jgi:hypothetical protein
MSTTTASWTKRWTASRAYPTDGATPFFVGSTAVEAAALNPASPFGDQFARTRFAIEVTDLTPGTYELVVVGSSGVSTSLDAAVWVGPITIR